jgi:hypothetical protein
VRGPLRELRYNLAHLGVIAVRDFYGQALQPPSEPTEDADTCTSVEAVVEVALSGVIS